MADGIYYTLGLRNRQFVGGMASAQAATRGLRTGLRGLAALSATVLGPLLGVAGAAAALGKALSSAANFEQTRVAFRTLIGDAKAAEDTLEGLRSFAASTPFELTDVADAAKKLLAFGTSTEELQGDLRAVGDIASGIGAPLTEMAELYGKARVQGTLFAEDINQLTGRGVPVIQEFARILGVTQGEVKKLASEGKITFPVLAQAFAALTGEGGKFFRMMEAQSRTTKGLLSTIKSGVDELFIALGTPINDAIKPILQNTITLVDDLKPKIADLGAVAGRALSAIFQAFREGRVLELLGAGLDTAAATFGNQLIAGGKALVSFLVAAFQSIRSSFFDSNFAKAFEALFAGLGNIVAGGIASALGKKDDANIFGQSAKNNLKAAKDFFEVGKSTIMEEIVRGVGEALESGGKAAGKSLQELDDVFGAAAKSAKLSGLLAELNRNAPKPEADAAGPYIKLPMRGRDEPAPRPALMDQIAALGKVPAPRIVEQREERPALLNAAESLRARYSRLSAADRKKLGSFEDFAKAGVSNRLLRAIAPVKPAADPAVTERKKTNKLLSDIFKTLDGVAAG